MSVQRWSYRAELFLLGSTLAVSSSSTVDTLSIGGTDSVLMRLWVARHRLVALAAPHAIEWTHFHRQDPDVFKQLLVGCGASH